MPRVLLACFFGFFFCIATFEVDVFEYDNTFFDTYDSYVKLDSKVIQEVFSIDFDRLTFPEFDLYSFSDSVATKRVLTREPRSSNYFYRSKLFLIKSSLLI
jgi:hypothetical protein